MRIWCLCQSRNGLDGNWQLPPILDRSSCFHGSILSLWMIGHLEVVSVYSRHDMNDKILPVPRSRSTVLWQQFSAKPALEHTLINRLSSGRFANFGSYSRSKSSYTVSSVRCGVVVVDKSVGTSMVSDLSSTPSLPVLAEQSEILEASSSHISATAP